jgi:hypothetical protein
MRETLVCRGGIDCFSTRELGGNDHSGFKDIKDAEVCLLLAGKKRESNE